MNAPIMRERRYERAGLLALDPQAFLSMFLLPDPPTKNTEIGDVDVVDIRGPLEQHAGGWCDSYEAVRARVRLACESPRSKAIVLRVDSPGGEVAGAFSTGRELRAMAAAANKTLWAYVEGRAHSAGYALACAAARIVLTDTATVGSIGVINTRPDYSARDAATGLRYAVNASGARKTDGHPHVAITDGELKASQAIVDDIAEVFFDLVAEMRGLTPAAVQGTEAGVFTGAGAIAASLADEVGTFEDVIAAISAGTEEETMKLKAGDIEDARAALERAAKGEGKEAAAAKRALAGLDAEPKDDDDDKKDDDEKAEDESDKPKDDDKKDDDKAAASSATVSARTAGDLASHSNTLESRVAALESQNEEGERGTFLASRPDLGPELVKFLKRKPLADVRAIVNAIPKPAIPKPAASASATATRGSTQGDHAPSAQAHDLDQRMGLATTRLGAERVGNVMRFGVMIAPPEPATDGGAK